MTADTLERPLTARPAVLARAGSSITLVRHGEPALSRKIRLSAAQYRQWWASYEIGGLLEGQNPPETLRRDCAGADLLFSSTRRRSIETARAAAGDREVLADPLFIEAPLPPPNFPAFIRFSPRTWGVIARFWWWMFDHHEGQETRDEAKARAVRAADLLIEKASEGRAVVVMAHGFFNGMVGMVLQRRGWRLTRDEGFQYWSRRRFEPPRA